MTFVKRRLQQDDTAPADLQAFGVEKRRLPTKVWDWAVDEEREASFTQLLSDTGEMREGDYWYALIAAHSLAVIQINAWSAIQIEDRLHLKVRISGHRDRRFRHRDRSFRRIVTGPRFGPS